MQKRVTIRQIAQAAGVSVATASVALNGKAGVSPTKRQEILDIAQQLHYFANNGARALKTQRNHCIGLIVTDIENAFFSALVNSCNRRAEELGYTVILMISDDIPEREAALVGMLISKGVDGMIITPCATPQIDLSHLRLLQDMKIPFICSTTYHADFPGACVMTELRSGEYQLVSHLLHRGCRKIFLLASDPHLIFSRLRIEGFQQAFRDCGVPFEPDWIYIKSPHYQSGYEFAMECISRHPDAVVTINDLQAMGAMKAFHDMGIRIPQDISVAGYDDIPVNALLTTPLTTVHQPIHTIAKITVDRLVAMIEQGVPEAGGEVVYLQPRLIVRDSTR